MKALTVLPGEPGSLAVSDVPDPRRGGGELLVEGIAVGVCGTDKEIAAGDYGAAPPGEERLVIGHESLGRVREAPSGSGYAEGDLVVGVVRCPDPVPCPACAHGEFDMCRNGRYTEHGIKELRGFAGEAWVVSPDHAVRLDPSLEAVGMLMEPTSVVAKAWEQVERIGARSFFAPRRVLVTGAGPIGLLAALLGQQRGLEVHVLDQVTDGPKPHLVHLLGATYHHDLEQAMAIEPDVIIEATGATPVVHASLDGAGSAGIVCLTGVSAAGSEVHVDMGALNRELVLDNNVIVGSVNANLRHYQLAAEALAKADPSWLERMVSRRVPLDDFAAAFEPRPDDVKVVLTL